MLHLTNSRGVSNLGGRAGYLPDISGRYNLWSLFATRCIIAKNYTGASGALKNMNALLDEDHRITVSTEELKRVKTQKQKFECNHCTMLTEQKIDEDEQGNSIYKKITVKNRINSSDVRVFELQMSVFESMVAKANRIKIWICPNCNNQNKISETNIIQPVTESPFYYGIVDDCPNRSSGISNRLGFHENFEKYFYNFSEELENAMKEYRISYIGQHGVDMAEKIGEKEDIP